MQYSVVCAAAAESDVPVLILTLTVTYSYVAFSRMSCCLVELVNTNQIWISRAHLHCPLIFVTCWSNVRFSEIGTKYMCLVSRTDSVISSLLDLSWVDLSSTLLWSGEQSSSHLDKMSSQMLYRYILRRTQIVSNAKRHKQLQLTSRKTRSNAYIRCIYIYSKQSR